MDKKQTYKLDESKLTPEQRDKLELYRMQEKQATALQDIADMTQEVIQVLDSQKQNSSKTTKDLGAVLVDIRERLGELISKEMPDSSQPVVDAVAKLESALTKTIAAIDVKPSVTVAAPEVTVSPTDLSALERVLKTDIPKAFTAAITALPAPEKDDYTPLIEVWQGISEQLVSLENATRMKPLPGTMKVTNPDGSYIGEVSVLTERYDYDDPTTIYVGKAALGTSENTTTWTVTKYDLTDTNNASAKIAVNIAWSNRTSGVYS